MTLTKISASSGSSVSLVNGVGGNLVAGTWGLVTGSGSAGVGFRDCAWVTDSENVFVVSAGT